MRHFGTLLPASGLADEASHGKITALCFSPDNLKIAVCGKDRIVRLFDYQGESKDRFSTKPSDKTHKMYIVCAMVFSPDSTRLAVAQSDHIVFVYKLGLQWGDKKSICNKLLQTSSVTGLTWPLLRPYELVCVVLSCLAVPLLECQRLRYGVAEGCVKLGRLRSHKSTTLYTTDSYVCAIASSTDGRRICSSHLDGCVYCSSLNVRPTLIL